MSTVSGSTSITSTTNQSSGQVSGGKAMDKDAFMKILVTQLKYQDPLQPMDDREFISQMAQFSSLEQMTNVSTNLNKLQKVDSLGLAFSLIGSTVSYKDADGNDQTGVVSSAEMKDGMMQVKVGEEIVNLADITSVQK